MKLGSLFHTVSIAVFEEICEFNFDCRLNRYAYVRNNPLRYTDPSGHAIVFSGGKIISTLLPTVQSKSAPTSYSSFVAAVSSPSRSSNSSGSIASNSGSSNSSSGGGGSSGGASSSKKDNSEARDIAKPFYNFYIGNDINVFRNSNSSIAQKGWAGLGIIGAVVPPVRGLKAPKVIEGIVDTSKIFSPDQAALIELAKEAKRTGVSADDAKTLLNWADEYGIKPALDHTGSNAHDWGYGYDHIRIGQQNHIEVK
jgi:hypothetical protein